MKKSKFDKILKKSKDTLLNCRTLSQEQITQLIIVSSTSDKELHEILYDYPNTLNLQDVHFLIMIKILLTREKEGSHIIDRMLKSCVCRIKDIGFFSQIIKDIGHESYYYENFIEMMVSRINRFYRKEKITDRDLYP